MTATLRRCSLLLALALAGLPVTTQELFRSNAIGMRLARIQSLPSSGYALEVKSAGATQEEVLWQDGQEVRRTVRRPAGSGGEVEEEVYLSQAQEPSESRLFDAAGRIVERKDGSGVSRYGYVGGVLDSIEALGADGELLYRERYAYTRTGYLREVIRTYADGSRVVSSYVFHSGTLAEERRSRDTDLSVARYDSRGRLLSERQFAGGKPTVERELEYQGDSSALRAYRERNVQAGYDLSRVFDEAGRPISEVQEGASKSRVTYTYDDQGRVVLERRVGPSGVEERTSRYGEDGSLSEERYLSRGRLLKVRVHTGERQWHEDLYRGGRPVLRVYYEDGEKSREELLP